MLKKLCIILCGALITTDSFATTDIAANAENSTCDNTVLGATEGDVNFDAKWAANEVELHWYSQGQQMNVQSEAQTCIYDGQLILPSTEPQRTGYMFAGWKIKSKNLFDQSSATLYKTAYDSNTGWRPVSATSNAVTYGLAVEPDTTYTIQKKGGNRLIITGFSTVRVPGENNLTPEFDIKTDISEFGNGSYTFTTPENCNWILFSLRNNNSTTTFPYDIQIEKGSSATEYEPY